MILLDSIDDRLDRFNTIDTATEDDNYQRSDKDYIGKANLIRERHNEIRDGFQRLNILASRGHNAKEFIEPRVQGLWKAALDAAFTPDELESLHVELSHYENRLLKLRHLQAEAALAEDRRREKAKIATGDKLGAVLDSENLIKKQGKKVEKLHLDIETRIMQKKIEL